MIIVRKSGLMTQSFPDSFNSIAEKLNDISHVIEISLFILNGYNTIIDAEKQRTLI
jgi:hypothetical protein